MSSSSSFTHFLGTTTHEQQSTPLGHDAYQNYTSYSIASQGVIREEEEEGEPRPYIYAEEQYLANERY